ncbi:MAG: SDR family oxidoreductase [Acidobacteria bacterium]|nr:SDR family oxidoreductase [Acidobacteriota bacterium]
MMPRLLITGLSGQVGSALARAAAGRFEVTGSFFRQPTDHPGGFHWDLRKDIEPVLDRYRPDLIVHTAALSAPAHCEQHPDDAHRIHTLATRDMARWAQRRQAYLIFLSTDLVFDGRKGDYTETDPVNPLSVYGHTKRSGETACLELCSTAAVIRPALIYGRSRRGDRGADEQIRHALSDGRTLTLFVDEFRTPVWLDDLVHVLLHFLGRRITGLFHVGGPRRLSRWEFGWLVARAAAMPTDHIRPASLETFIGAPPRSPDVSLDCTRLTTEIPFALQSPEEVLFQHQPR